MKSASYYLQFGNFNITSGTKTSGSYNLTDTAGQTGAGFYGGSRDVKSGFQYIYPFATPLPTASPSATPTATPSASPSATPIGLATPFPEVTPEATPSSILNLLEKAGFLSPVLAQELAKIITATIPALVALAPILVTAAAVAQTVASFLPLILEIISRFLQSIGLIPVKRPRGVVFDTKNGAPIAFATITFIRVSDNQIIDTVVSDTSGIYRSIKLPPGIYRIEAIHSDYLFPTKVSPKFLVNPHDFYRGENFEIRSSNQEELFLIPMDPIFEEARQQKSFYLQILFSYLRRLVHSLFYPMVIFSLIMTIIFPTTLNIGIVILYALMIFYRYQTTKRQPRLSGTVIDRHGRPLTNTLIRCTETGTNHVAALLATNAKGEFSVNLPPHQYTLVINKDGYVVEQKSQDYTSVFIAHTGAEGDIVIHMMTVTQAFPDNA